MPVPQINFSSWLPPSLPGCILWLRGDQGITIGTGVAQWNDISGNGHNVTQATGSAQPTYNTNDAAYNKQSTLSFLGSSSQFLSSASFTGPEPATFIVIGNNTSIGSNNTFLDFATTHNLIIYLANTGLELIEGSSDVSAFSPLTPSVIAGIFNGASSAVYMNSSSSSTMGTTGGAAGTGGIGIGVEGNGAGVFNVNFLTGKIAEVIVYNGVLTQQQISQVFQYASARYSPGNWI